MQVLLARNPFEARGHEALWQILASGVEKEIGRSGQLVGENAWGDAALFQEAGIPTLMLGAEGFNFHAHQEWVSIPELGKLAKIIEATVQRFCA